MGNTYAEELAKHDFALLMVGETLRLVRVLERRRNKAVVEVEMPNGKRTATVRIRDLK